MNSTDEARLLQISNFEGRSNSAAVESDEDVRLVKNAIHTLEATLAAAEAQNPPPLNIEAQRQHISRLKVAIAPHKKLVPDIWTSIFLLTVSDDPEFYAGSAEVLGTLCISRYTPWKLSRVCSLWRNLICNRPFFWRRIAIQTDSSSRVFDSDYFPEPGEVIDMNHPAIVAWTRVVQKAYNLVPAGGPISIGIRGSDPTTGLFSGGASLLSTPVGVNFVRGIGSRLTNLNVQWCEPNQLVRLLSIPPAAFPVLEGLSVNYGWISPDIIFGNTDLFSISTLRRVAVHGSMQALAAILESPVIPWNQYRDVTIHQVTDIELPHPTEPLTSPHFTFILPQLTNVIKLSVKLDLINPATPPNPHAITYPSMTYLHLDTKDVNLLYYFTTPSLRTLDLVRSPSEEDTFEAINSTVNLINRSGCSLRTFHEAPGTRTYLGCPMHEQPAVFRGLLTHLQEVRDFKLYGVVLGPEEVREIGTFELLPHARNLDFPCEVPYQEILEMLHDRLTHGTRALERLRARSWSKPANFKQGQEITREYKENHAVHVDLHY